MVVEIISIFIEFALEVSSLKIRGDNYPDTGGFRTIKGYEVGRNPTVC